MDLVYAKLDKLGEGTHGIVSLAVDLRVLSRLRSEQACAEYRELAREMRMTSDERADLKLKRLQLDRKHATPPEALVALKKIMVKDASTGVSMDAVRELKILQELDSEYVLKILDIYTMDSNINVVLTWCRGDLSSVLANPSIVLQPADVKSYLRMLLLGVQHCHANYILHRDIKPENCLLDAGGVLKLADFGLARPVASPERDMTPRVYTSWYRPPELLFCARSYGPAADIWACGCVFAQMILRRPLFATRQDSELEQLHVICQALGAPSEKNWPGCELLPGFLHQADAPAAPVLWTTTFASLAPDALDLLRAMLALDPKQRPTAEQALAHVYFASAPEPTPVERLPR